MLAMMTAGKRNGASGFTLVELLITLAAAIILATIAVPGFQSMLERSQLTSSYNNIVSGLNYARSEAIKRRDNVTFDVSMNEDSAAIYRVFVGNYADAESGIELLLDRRIENFSSSADVFWVTFGPIGRRENCINTEACQFSIEHGETKKVAVGLAGRVGMPLDGDHAGEGET